MIQAKIFTMTEEYINSDVCNKYLYNLISNYGVEHYPIVNISTVYLELNFQSKIKEFLDALTTNPAGDYLIITLCINDIFYKMKIIDNDFDTNLKNIGFESIKIKSNFNFVLYIWTGNEVGKNIINFHNDYMMG